MSKTILILKTIFVAVFSSFVLASCASRGTGDLLTELPPQVTTVAGSDVLTSTTARETLGPLDVITVKVFGAPDLSGDYQVDYEGKLKLPLINEVDAMGQTRLSLARVLKSKYEENYLQNAEVTILMKNSRDRTFAIDGSVARPGRYPIKVETSLMEAIATSGGVDEYANLKRVVVFREVNGEKYVAGFNLKSIRDGDTPDPEIAKDDIIIVDGSKLPEARREIISSLPLLAFFRPF